MPEPPDFPPFPTVLWGEARVTFHSEGSENVPAGAARASLVFAFDGDRIALANISGRGWCVPSGRIESGETAEECGRREAWEEAGLMLGELLPLGKTVIRSPSGETLAVNFAAVVLGAGPIPPSESLGVQFVTRSELEQRYYRWDELISAIFDHAWTFRARLRKGT